MSSSPITHLRSQLLETTIDGVTSETIIYDLVHENQTLIELTTDDAAQLFTLEAGKNSELSVDQRSLIASETGYPALNQVIEDEKTILRVDIAPLIEVKEDDMEATLTLYPATDQKALVSLSDILGLCKRQNISNGIDSVMIQETIDKVVQQSCPQVDVTIARGLLPVDGRDAYLRFEVEIGPLPGKILKDGSIDWRERKMFIGIDKDELIATKVDPTAGTPGVNIFGETIAQSPGKDIKVKVSGDVEYNEESRKILATGAGVLSIVNENNVKVNAKHTISGDVDFSVGNVESNNGLEIKGSVNPGFKVNCKGDLLIEGNISNGTVSVKGNAKIRSGLLGENARLVTEGDVEISFVERGSIKCGGTVVISKGCYYGNIASDNKILCHRDSKVVGGTLCCADDFIGGNVGSDNAAPLTIAAGIEPYRLAQYERQKQRILELRHELEGLTRMHGKEYAKTVEYKKLESNLEKIRSNIKKFNLIKGSPLYSGFGSGHAHSDATISIQGRIVSGTKIRIGNTATTVVEDTISIRFHHDRKSGDIVATPYTEGK